MRFPRWKDCHNVFGLQRLPDEPLDLGAVDFHEVIESYPDDKYLPSYLVLAHHSSDAFHILFAVDIDANHVRVVTAYRPDQDEWEGDLKTRRAKQ